MLAGSASAWEVDRQRERLSGEMMKLPRQVSEPSAGTDFPGLALR